MFIRFVSVFDCREYVSLVRLFAAVAYQSYVELGIRIAKREKMRSVNKSSWDHQKFTFYESHRLVDPSGVYVSNVTSVG